MAGPVENDDARLGHLLEFSIGILSLAMAPVVVGGDILLSEGSGFRGSLSAHFYGPTKAYFVGFLLVIGLCLVAYGWRGRSGTQIGAALIGLAAIGVAAFPTPAGTTTAGSFDWWVSLVHVACATGLFVGHALFAMHFSRLGYGPGPLQDSRSTLVFRLCALTIGASVVAIAVAGALDLGLTLWLQSLATTAIGVSWLAKSRLG